MLKEEEAKALEAYRRCTDKLVAAINQEVSRLEGGGNSWSAQNLRMARDEALALLNPHTGPDVAILSGPFPVQEPSP